MQKFASEDILGVCFAIEDAESGTESFMALL